MLGVFRRKFSGHETPITGKSHLKSDIANYTHLKDNFPAMSTFVFVFKFIKICIFISTKRPLVNTAIISFLYETSTFCGSDEDYCGGQMITYN